MRRRAYLVDGERVYPSLEMKVFNLGGVTQPFPVQNFFKGFWVEESAKSE